MFRLRKWSQKSQHVPCKEGVSVNDGGKYGSFRKLGALLWCPYNKDPTNLEYYIRVPYFRKPPYMFIHGTVSGPLWLYLVCKRCAGTKSPRMRPRSIHAPIVHRARTELLKTSRFGASTLNAWGRLKWVHGSGPQNLSLNFRRGPALPFQTGLARRPGFQRTAAAL